MPPLGIPGTPPPVVKWFKVYAAVMCALYVLLIALGGLWLVIPDLAADEDAWIMTVVFLAVGLPFLALFGAALFLPPKPWVWIYDIVLICLGFTSCLTLPFCIALLVYWLKPETKAYFGRT